MALTAIVAAGCSSPAVGHSSTTTTGAPRPVPRATSTTTSTTAPGPTTTAVPVPSSVVQIQISGTSATLTFASADLSGSLSPGTGTFSQGGTVYTFVVAGVHYTGAPASSNGSGLIKTVAVGGTSGGASVTVTLSGPASHASYGLGHNEVGVTFS